MNSKHIETIEQAAAQSIRGEISFGEVVGRLMAIGLERYHADYTRGESTFYFPDGSTHVVALPVPAKPIADAFSAAAVESAVRQAQRGELKYAGFLEKTFDAGCVGYFVLIAGRCVQYFGRRGETHVEKFPSK